MATQSLYRRYRPRRFSEVKGQEHVVRSLRNAVINHREGQAYLFSGPRGTGKTTSARILAKVLNCENPQDGEPCCECESCLAVERGSSFDVHELDAASNNGVEAIREIIEKAALGTPGRHRVYILDEVHMLTKGAEAALLKTLEEPPPHVVFVLATTDPQKVSETIRSRTQHLQFHLLPMDVMESHIRWLAGDAGIDLTDDALQSVLRQGGGSARDTVSALELVASGGGEPLDITPLDEFIEAFIEHDPGRALAVVALAVQQGRDPRTLTDDIVRHLRDCFLSLMAPELVQLPAQRADEVSSLAQRLGAAATVRAMERLGQMLVEMRHAPDPRLLLEVALVQLTHEAASNDMSVLLDRIERLEQHLAAGPAAAPAVRATPIDPATGRAALGGRARRDPPAAAPAAAAPAAPAAAAVVPPSPSAPPAVPPAAVAAPAAAAPAAAVPAPAARAGPGCRCADARSGPGASSSGGRSRCRHRRPLGCRHQAEVEGVGQGSVLEHHGVGRAKRRVHARSVERGHPREVRGAPHRRAGCDRRCGRWSRGRAARHRARPRRPRRRRSRPRRHDHGGHDHGGGNRAAQAGGPEASPAPIEEEAIDLDDLVDAPPEAVVSPLDRLQQAFPGSQLVEE